MIAAIPADQAEGQCANIAIMYERSPDGSLRILSYSAFDLSLARKAAQAFRASMPRICLSCGAKTNSAGELPCGH